MAASRACGRSRAAAMQGSGLFETRPPQGRRGPQPPALTAFGGMTANAERAA